MSSVFYVNELDSSPPHPTLRCGPTTHPGGKLPLIHVRVETSLEQQHLAKAGLHPRRLQGDAQGISGWGISAKNRLLRHKVFPRGRSKMAETAAWQVTWCLTADNMLARMKLDTGNHREDVRHGCDCERRRRRIASDAVHDFARKLSFKTSGSPFLAPGSAFPS